MMLIFVVLFTLQNVDEWNRAGMEFRRYRDKDGDGFIDKHELKVKINKENCAQQC